MSEQITFKAETAEGHIVEMKLSVDEAVKMIAKVMLIQGTSVMSVKVDDLHDAMVMLQWSPKDRRDVLND